MAHRSMSATLAPLPWMRIATRNTRPAATTHRRAVIRTMAMPNNGCHIGMPGGTARRMTINIGVAGGNKERPRANEEFGSRTTLSHTNIGKTKQQYHWSHHTLSFFQIADGCTHGDKIEPNMTTAKT